MTWFCLAALIVVPIGAKMLDRSRTGTTPNRRPSYDCPVSVNASNIDWQVSSFLMMVDNSTSIFPRVGGMAMGWGWARSRKKGGGTHELNRLPP